MNLKIFAVFLGVALVIALIIYFYAAEFSPTDKKTTVEINENKFFVNVLDTADARAKGLAGREKLNENEGMLFIFEEPGLYGFWMKDMKFPIDIVWIRDGKIVGFSENIEPQIGASEAELKTYYPPEPVDGVLEINAGEAKKRGLETGDFARF